MADRYPAAMKCLTPDREGLPGQTSCLTLVWAVLDRASRGWRRFTMTAGGLRLPQDLRRSLLDPPCQLRSRTATATQGDDQPGAVRASA